MSVSFAPIEPFPDLIFGLVGPIGVDLEYITQSLSDSLVSYNYNSDVIPLTRLMRDINCSKSITDTDDLALSYSMKIDYANELRHNFKANDILAALAVNAIRKRRRELSDDRSKKECGRAFYSKTIQDAGRDTFNAVGLW